MLNISKASLQRYAKRGIIASFYIDSGRVRHFKMHDLSAFAESLEKQIDLRSVADISMQAYVTSKSNERRLDELYYLLGFDKPTLGTTEEEVIALHIRAQETIHITEYLEGKSVHEWAGVFYAIDEAYLNLVKIHTSSEEPWTTYLDLANKMIETMPTHLFATNQPLKSAYAYLATSRDNLRSAAYFSCRTAVGMRKANKAFNHADDPIEDVIHLLFPPLSQVQRAR